RLRRPETPRRNSGPASYLVLRGLDRLRLPRGWVTLRARGRRSAGRNGAMARTAARTGASRGVAMSRRTAKTATYAAADETGVTLYFGEVMHARLKPMGHRFSYRVMSLLIDLDRLEVADRQSRLFGVNRTAIYSFNEADHGPRDGSSLRHYAQRCAE